LATVAGAATAAGRLRVALINIFTADAVADVSLRADAVEASSRQVLTDGVLITVILILSALINLLTDLSVSSPAGSAGAVRSAIYHTAAAVRVACAWVVTRVRIDADDAIALIAVLADTQVSARSVLAQGIVAAGVVLVLGALIHVLAAILASDISMQAATREGSWLVVTHVTRITVRGAQLTLINIFTQLDAIALVALLTSTEVGSDHVHTDCVLMAVIPPVLGALVNI